MPRVPSRELRALLEYAQIAKAARQPTVTVRTEVLESLARELGDARWMLATAEEEIAGLEHNIRLLES